MKKDRYPIVTPSGVTCYPLGGNEGATERGRSRRSDGDPGIVKGNLGPEGAISLPDQGQRRCPLGAKRGPKGPAVLAIRSQDLCGRSWSRIAEVLRTCAGGPADLIAR